VQQRLYEVVEKVYGGVKAQLVRTCGFSRDTAAKWFGQDFRVPDTLTLKRIAERSGVSLDWLVLGRGEMLWPAASPGAQAELFGAVRRQMLRMYARDAYLTEAAESVLQDLGHEGVWDLLVKSYEGIPDLGGRIGLMAYHSRH
jgi:hypothetical protein